MTVLGGRHDSVFCHPGLDPGSFNTVILNLIQDLIEPRDSGSSPE
jgi:hypothetical protein